jgi:hypothetical protein
MTIDQGYAAWLKSAALYTSSSDPEIAARWGASGLTVDSEVLSPLAFKADADTEAARQAAFMGGPLVIDEVLALGRLRKLRGQTISVKIDKLGYANGVSAFVVGVTENENGTSTLSVVRPMKRGASAIRHAYISPTGSGDFSGSSSTNAARLTQLNAMVARAAAGGGEVLILADAGPYTITGPISLSTGGVTIRGVDSLGNNKQAEIVGNRADPWTKGAAYGPEGIRLNSGANNLAIRFLKFRNMGAGCIRLREAVTNITVTDIAADNIGRGIVAYGNAGADATVIGLTIQRINITRFSKHGIAVRNNSRGILIEDCDFDSGDIDLDFITCGVQIDDKASNGIIRRVHVKNVLNRGPGSYYNGDGISGEYSNADWTVEDCSAENTSDGGIDWKGSGFRLVNFVAKRCKRSIRLWGQADVINAYSENPTSRGGSGATCHVFAMQGGRSRVRIQGGTFIQQNANAIFRVDNNALIAWDSAALAGITASAGYAVCQSEADDQTDSLFGLWDHTDTAPPSITSATSLSINENKPGVFRVKTTEPCTLKLRGPDASAFYLIGRDFKMYAQDFEKPGGVASDGSNVLKVELQAMDINGNLSNWTPYAVTINDVGDDPISPEQAIALSGATDGYWIDFSRPDTLFQDVERTIPAGEGDVIKAVTDLSGFGHHWVFADGYEPVLTQTEGYLAPDFNGQVIALVGAPGTLLFPQFTVVTAIRRSRETAAGTFNTFWTARRSKTTGTSDNSAFRLGFLDTSTTQFKTDPNSSVGGTATSPVGKALVVSLRSTDGILRTGYDSNGMSDKIDGTDLAAVRYVVTDDQPLYGGRYSGLGYTDFFQGFVHFAMQLNKPLSDEVRSRIELQASRSGGALT